MIVVETFDPPFAVLVASVLWAGVPKVHMSVDDEDLVSALAIHCDPLSSNWLTLVNSMLFCLP